MDKERLISKQQLEIETLKEKIEKLYAAMEKINGALFCIGAPLNDNKLQFNRKQIAYLQKNIVEFILLEENNND